MFQTNGAEFNANLAAIADKKGMRVEQVVRSVAFQIFRYAVMGTPVDTGRARSNWTVAINQVDRTVIEPPASDFKSSRLKDAKERSEFQTMRMNLAGQTSELRARPIKNYKLGDVIVISNSVSYIRFLEDGTPHMRPFHMARNALAAVRAEFAYIASQARNA